MVQILNKMVHLKSPGPILEIWCCHKHITQLPSSRLKLDTKLRKVFPNNLAPQLYTSHSCREILHPILSVNVCSSQSNFNASLKNSDFWLPLALVTLLKCLLQGSNLAKKLRNMSPRSLSAQRQLCTSHSRRENIAPNFVCLLQPIKCKHLKLRFLAPFGTCYSQL